MKRALTPGSVHFVGGLWGATASGIFAVEAVSGYSTRSDELRGDGHDAGVISDAL